MATHRDVILARRGVIRRVLLTEIENNHSGPQGRGLQKQGFMVAVLDELFEIADNIAVLAAREGKRT